MKEPLSNIKIVNIYRIDDTRDNDTISARLNNGDEDAWRNDGKYDFNTYVNEIASGYNENGGVFWFKKDEAGNWVETSDQVIGYKEYVDVYNIDGIPTADHNVVGHAHAIFPNPTVDEQATFMIRKRDCASLTWCWGHGFDHEVYVPHIRGLYKGELGLDMGVDPITTDIDVNYDGKPDKVRYYGDNKIIVTLTPTEVVGQ